MKKIELHIFTNATVNAPSTEIIEQTYKSFCEKFQFKNNPIVWYDPKPNKDSANIYLERLEKIFPTVNLTSSLSDGYKKSVLSSNAEFLFMLEHDWLFLETIKHSLEEICNQMILDNLLHLRFNKRKNITKGLDTYLNEVVGKNFTYCKTPSLSNNPHIIQKDLYKKIALQYVKVSKSSMGIEHKLSPIKHLEGAIYGPMEYHATIEHLDGRSL